MNININVKIKAGPRTPVEVTAYCTAVNAKIIVFANGKRVSGTQIADWIQDELTVALKKIQDAI